MTKQAEKDKEWYEFARITDESGLFNEDCEVPQAEAMLKAGILSSFDGEDDLDYCVERFYTVKEENEDAVMEWLKAHSTSVRTNDTDEAPSPANRFPFTAAACTVARIAMRAGLERVANWIVRAEWDRLDHTIAPEIGWYDLAARCPWAFKDARGYRDRIGRLIQPTRGTP